MEKCVINAVGLKGVSFGESSGGGRVQGNEGAKAQRTSEDKKNPPSGRAEPVTHTHITHCIHTHKHIHTHHLGNRPLPPKRD